jgi:hypothetical protein
MLLALEGKTHNTWRITGFKSMLIPAGRLVGAQSD